MLSLYTLYRSKSLQILRVVPQNKINTNRCVSTIPDDLISKNSPNQNRTDYLDKVFSLEILDEEVKVSSEIEKQRELPKDLRNADKEGVAQFFGVPEDHLKRKVVIYRPAKVATQHGWGNTRKWSLKYEEAPRWENPLMGWTSGNDPFSALNIKFNSEEAAIEYCQENGLNYELQDPNVKEHKPTPRVRGYGARFAYRPPPPKITDY